jgi:hypothetical protein
MHQRSSIPFLLWLLASSFAAMQGQAVAQCNGASLRIRVDSVEAGEAKAWVDPRLGAETRGRLLTLFDYSSYRLLMTEEVDTPCGQPVVFNLPGDRILHVWPLAIHGNLIAVDLVMFAGARAVMRTQLKVIKGGLLVLVGSQSQQGADLTNLRIDAADREAATPGLAPQTAVASPLASGQKPLPIEGRRH